MCGVPRARQVSATKLYAPSPTYAHLQPCQSQAQAGLPRTPQDHTEPLVLPLPAPDTESLSQSWTQAIISSVAFVVCVCSLDVGERRPGSSRDVTTLLPFHLLLHAPFFPVLARGSSHCQELMAKTIVGSLALPPTSPSGPPELDKQLETVTTFPKQVALARYSVPLRLSSGFCLLVAGRKRWFLCGSGD